MVSILWGDIRWAKLNPVSGSEQGGLRPVLILSQNVFNLQRDPNRQSISAAVDRPPYSVSRPRHRPRPADNRMTPADLEQQMKAEFQPP